MTSVLYFMWFRKVYIQQSCIMIFFLLEKLDEIRRNNYALDLCVEKHVYNSWSGNLKKKISIEDAYENHVS